MTGSVSHSARRGACTRLVIIAASAVLASIVATPPHALAAASAGTTFHGSCTIVGTDSAENSTSGFRGQGVCIGSFNGGPAVQRHVVAVLHEHGLISPDYFGLPAVHGGSKGTGSFTFGTRCGTAHSCPTVRFAIQHSLAEFTVQGLAHGIGSGTAEEMPAGMLRLTMTTCGTTLAG